MWDYLRKLQSKRLLFCVFLCLSITNTALAESIRVATSANFAPVLKKIIPAFELQHKVKVQVISAATGTLYQQALHGAPFDVFLSADSQRPEHLVTQGVADKSTLVRYAVGQLSFYSAQFPKLTPSDLNTTPDKIKRLAIANPSYAPYGIAAKQVLTKTNLWKVYEKKVILGINVNQTFQQTRSRAASAGFVATSQLVLNGLKGHKIPKHLYQPIVQKAVMLNTSKAPGLSKKFLNYLMSAKVQQQISTWGYLTVGNTK